MGRLVAVAVVILLFSMGVGTASALPPPAVEFIPDRFTADSSFIAISDVQGTGPVRMSWVVPGTGNFGQFPNVNGKYACYFSNMDMESTCGPYPFIPGLSANLTLTVSAQDSTGDNSSTQETVDIGSIELDLVIQIEGNGVQVVVFPGSQINSAQMAVYGQNFGMEKAAQTMECKIVGSSGFQCVSNVTLGDGEHFIAVTAQGPSGSGGNLERITVGQSSNGGQPEGGGDVRIDNVNFAVLIGAGDVYEVSNLQIVNLGNQTLSGLSISIPQGLSNILSLTLQNNTIGPFGSTLFKVRLSGIDSPTGIFTTAQLRSGTETISSFPINITVSVKDVAAPSGTGFLPVAPDSFTGEFLISEAARQDFTVSNTVSQMITFGQPSYTGNLGGGTVSVSTPGSIQAGGSGTLTVSISPFSSGLYQGAITIPTEAGTILISVSAEFFQGIEESASVLQNDLDDFDAELTSEQAAALSSSILDIRSRITSAQASADFGDYGEAEAELEAARAQFSLLRSFITSGGSDQSPPSGGLDMTYIFAAVIIVVVILAVVVVYKKKFAGSRKAKEKGREMPGDEDDFDEELEESGEEEF